MAKALLFVSLLVNTLLLTCGILYLINQNIHQVDVSATTKKQTLWPAHSKVVYGHVHMAKTAGTEINGILAAQYERVCGHKGYSYDAYQTNERAQQWRDRHSPSQIMKPQFLRDSISMLPELSKFNRGKVPPVIMDEIGYEDCDWISHEVDWEWWTNLTTIHAPQLFQGTRLELHILCRDPIEHLMSMGNFQNKQDQKFNCNITTPQEIAIQVEQCLLHMPRFNTTSIPPNTSLKCFNPIPIQPYLDYVGSKLQPKRLPRQYVHRDTNRPRQKEKECLLPNQALQLKVQQYMQQNIPLYQFCKQCMGSNNDLFVGSDGS